jgi:pyruvate formate lyase activating enzyme
MYSRRDFLKVSFGGFCTLSLLNLDIPDKSYAFSFANNLSHVEAMHYKKHPYKEIECEICPRKCKVGDRERGYCGVKENQGGRYYTLVHSRPCSINIDPIEKKPFFHFLPATPVFSLATAGCNVNCKFCQNWEISQSRPEQTRNILITPAEVISEAQKYRCPSIAYTYSEPVIFYEYMYDVAKLGRKKGVRSVMVSGGYINKDPLVELCKYLDAVKIDLKGFTEKYYKEVCRGTLKPILDGLKVLNEIGIWFEIVYLMVPTLNDNERDIRNMCIWIKDELNPYVPLHFTRFYPMYLLKNLQPTPISSLEKAHNIAKEVGLKYVYIGNVPGHRWESTFCHRCGKILIRRFGYSIMENNIEKGKCKFCKESIPGIWA